MLKWKLILQLSLFGFVMAFATVFWIPGDIEMFFWLPVFIICAYIIAKRCTSKYFLHGFMVSIFNCIWITSAHIIFYNTYMPNHPEEARMLTQMPMPDSPRLMMLIGGAFFGTVFGLVLGLFASIAGKIANSPD